MDQLTEPATVSLVLRRLRAQSGLSVREVADFLHIPHTTYAHYESNRFKKSYLPYELTTQLAELFGRHGVDEKEVRALAGGDESTRQAVIRAAGLGEAEAVRYTPAETDAATMPMLEKPGIDLWEIRGRALDLAGLIPGDIVAADITSIDAKAGDVVIAQLYNWSEDKATTVFRVYEPPFLLASSTDAQFRKPHLVDNHNVMVKGIVRASYRRYARSA